MSWPDSASYWHPMWQYQALRRNIPDIVWEHPRPVLDNARRASICRPGSSIAYVSTGHGIWNP
eukprot:1115262-Rhodomonas_salina.1